MLLGSFWVSLWHGGHCATWLNDDHSSLCSWVCLLIGHTLTNTKSTTTSFQSFIYGGK